MERGYKSKANVKTKYTDSVKSAVILVTLNKDTCSLIRNLLGLLRITNNLPFPIEH
jgi:hypothetical protein